MVGALSGYKGANLRRIRHARHRTSSSFIIPTAGTSRNVVRIVEAAGYTPVIVEYLKTGWTKPQLLALFAAAGVKTARRTAPSRNRQPPNSA